LTSAATQQDRDGIRMGALIVPGQDAGIGHCQVGLAVTVEISHDDAHRTHACRKALGGKEGSIAVAEE